MPEIQQHPAIGLDMEEINLGDGGYNDHHDIVGEFRTGEDAEPYVDAPVQVEDTSPRANNFENEI